MKRDAQRPYKPLDRAYPFLPTIEAMEFSEARQQAFPLFYLFMALLLFMAGLFLALQTIWAPQLLALLFLSFAVSVLGFSYWQWRKRHVIPKTTADEEVLQELVSRGRQAMVLTDLRARPIMDNRAYRALLEDQNIIFVSFLTGIGRDSQKTWQRLFDDVRRYGEGAAQFFRSAPDDVELRVSGQRAGAFILWELVVEGGAASLEREIKFIDSWAKPFLERVESGVVVEDDQGRLRYANSIVRDWFGLGPEDVLPERLQFKDGQQQLLIPTGHRIDVDVLTMPLRSKIGARVFGKLIYIRNIHKGRLNILEHLNDSLIRVIFEAAPIAIALVDEKAELVECNGSFVRLYERSKALEKKSILGLVVEEEQEKLAAMVRDTCQGRLPAKPFNVHFTGDHAKEGQIFFSMIDAENRRLAILYLTDKTQEKQFEHQFVQAQKMQAIGQLAGGVAHDFNNLLTAILGFCDLLLMRHDVKDHSFSDLMQIKQNANRAANLVRQLLAFSRQQTMRPVLLNITDVIADISNLLRRLIGERIEFRVNHGRDLPPIKADQGQIEQVIINLVVNARDAMPEGGSLDIQTRLVKPGDILFERYDLMQSGTYVLIEVKDTGVGIDPAHVEKIFEPFFTTKSVGEGTGLGLATVYGIVKQTGGYVFCASELGMGASFLVLIRVDPAQQNAVKTRAEEIEHSHDLTGSGLILLVEDEDAVRLFAARALKSKGYEVVEAANAEEALEVLEQHKKPISLVITDVVMPGMDGPSLAVKIREKQPDLPIIFISGYAEDMLRSELGDQKNYFLSKPFSLKALAELTKEVLND